jgi:uncharacterized protein with PQ loop repeat
VTNPQPSRKRWRIAVAVAVLFAVAAIAPRRVEACMACVNNATAIQFPFVSFLIAAFVCWLIASYSIHNLRRNRGTDDPQEGVKIGVRSFMYVGIPVLLLGVLILNPLGLGFLVVLIWIGYLLVTTITGFRNRLVDSAYKRNQQRLNLLACLIVVVVIPASYARARSMDGLISSLGHAPPHYPQVCRIPILGLIEKGEPAVEPLIEALDAEFQESGYVDHKRVSQVSYCLSQIGGDEAELALGKVVAEHVSFDENSTWYWEVVACCSYAECAGKRAVPILLRVFNEAEGEYADLQKAVALCALIRTRSPDAVAFVLDNYDFLKKVLPGI